MTSLGLSSWGLGGGYHKTQSCEQSNGTYELLTCSSVPHFSDHVEMLESSDPRSMPLGGLPQRMGFLAVY